MNATTTPTKEEHEQAVLANGLSHWIVGAVRQHGPRIAIGAVGSALAICCVSAAMTREETMKIAGEMWDLENDHMMENPKLSAMLQQMKAARASRG